jgi:glycosyltransferase involved in cell wall biosynthesis
MKIVILSSLSYSLINFRGQLLRALVDAGHEVVACAPDREEEVVAALSGMGIRFRETRMARTGTNPLQDVSTLFSYVRLLLAEKPDAVLAYTQKPIIYGGLAARLVSRARFYVLMSGLGYVYSAVAEHRTTLRRIVSFLYRLGVARAKVVFVFNSDDRRIMMENKIIDDRHQVVQVPGSGVDLVRFTEQPMADGPPTFLMMSRLMRDKGVGEFIQAAALVRQKIPDARFQLLGRLETENPTGYSAEELAKYCASGLIEHLPETRDVRPYLAQAHALVLPSYYREGLPRSLLEALATGRPIITTDLPGCREPVRLGKNGYLVPPRDHQALAAAMLRLAADPKILHAMGRSAREVAVDEYDVDKVNKLLIRSMQLDVPAPSPSAPPRTNAPRPLTQADC